MTNKCIKTITFEEIINQAFKQKEQIAQDFLDIIEKYYHEYSYYTLIVDFRDDIKDYHLNFIVDTETDNAYVMGFNLKLMTFCKDEYAKSEITEDLIINLLEKELDKLKEITTPKNED